MPKRKLTLGLRPPEPEPDACVSKLRGAYQLTRMLGHSRRPMRSLWSPGASPSPQLRQIWVQARKTSHPHHQLRQEDDGAADQSPSAGPGPKKG